MGCAVALSVAGCETEGAKEAVAETQAALCTPDVLTQGFGIERTHAQLCETTLNPSNVNSGQFGKLYSRYVDGRIFAQPLYAEGVATSSGTKNVVYVATANNVVYGFDAGATSKDPYAGVIWSRDLGSPANVDHLNASTSGAVCTGVAYPYSGIIGTPTIDKAHNRMYLVAEKELSTNVFSFWVHTLDIGNGNDLFPPVQVPSTVGGVTFDAALELQRPGLLLLGGDLFIAFSGSCGDPATATRNFHGFVLEYQPAVSTLNFVRGFSTTTGTDGGAGIWQSGIGLVGKVSSNSIYAMSGNGHRSTGDYSVPNGDAFLKFSPFTGTLNPQVYQQPNDSALAAADLDLGAGGPMLLPNGVLFGGGKTGTLFKFDTSSTSTDVGGSTPPPSFQATHCAPGVPAGNCTEGAIAEGMPPHIHARAYWNNRIFLWGERDVPRVYDASSFPPTQLAQGTIISNFDASVGTASYGWRVPPVFSISANDTTSGLLWAVKTRGPHVGAGPNAPPATLYALNASTLAPLYDTDMRAQDVLPSHPRFTIPTVAAGKVYVATFSDELAVYGLKTPVSTGIPPNAQLSVLGLTANDARLFVVANGGQIQTSRWNGISWSALSDLISDGATTPPAPPGAPLAGVIQNSQKMSLFYVNNLGELTTIWWEPADNSYHTGGLSASLGEGGRGTAPPGAPVAAISLLSGGSATSIHVAVVTYYGAVIKFDWSSTTGWGPSGNWDMGYGSNTTHLRAPVTLVSHDPPHSLESYLINRRGELWNSWWDDSTNTWHPGLFASSPTFPARTPIAAVAKSTSAEDLAAVGSDGRVYRAFWDGSWSHTGYTPLGNFSSTLMLPARAPITLHARDVNNGNILAVDAAGQIMSEWWANTSWQFPSPFAWGNTLSSAWGVFMGGGTASPGTAVAALGNTPSTNNLDLFWVDGSGVVWNRHYNNSWANAIRLN